MFLAHIFFPSPPKQIQAQQHQPSYSPLQSETTNSKIPLWASISLPEPSTSWLTVLYGAA
jgi:hypothetical protein